MKKDTNKYIALTALIVAVLALAIGFATYTSTLTIGAHDVTVGSDTFTPNLNYKAASVSCPTKTEGVTVESTGTVSQTAWTGISIAMSKPGDSVTCQATIENTSNFDAFLDEMNTAAALSCEAKADSSNPATTGIDDACSAMKLTVTTGEDSITATSTAAGSKTGISNNQISKISGGTAGEKLVTFTLTYQEGSKEANGDFIVKVPQVNLIYKTED